MQIFRRPITQLRRHMSQTHYRSPTQLRKIHTDSTLSLSLSVSSHNQDSPALPLQSTSQTYTHMHKLYTSVFPTNVRSEYFVCRPLLTMSTCITHSLLVNIFPFSFSLIQSEIKDFGSPYKLSYSYSYYYLELQEQQQSSTVFSSHS